MSGVELSRNVMMLVTMVVVVVVVGLGFRV